MVASCLLFLYDLYNDARIHEHQIYKPSCSYTYGTVWIRRVPTLRCLIPSEPVCYSQGQNLKVFLYIYIYIYIYNNMLYRYMTPCNLVDCW